VIVGGRIGQVPYSIEDLWVRVKARFADDAVLQSVVFRDGHQYLEEEDGGNRIVFVQDDPELSFGAVRGGRGEIGTLTDACKAHVWGVEQAKDYGLDQGIAAKSLVVELCSAAYLEFAGMIAGGIISVSMTTQVLKYGEHCIVSIRLRCPIEKVTTMTALHIGGAETRL
jgi:hypothetical protein